MKRTTGLIVTGMVLAAAYAQPSLAQEGCADIDFGSAITDQFPNAAASCLGVAERDGRQFARFQAEILGATGANVRARFRRPDGSFSPTYDIAIDPDARVQIGGRSYRYRDLAPGQEVDIYVPPDLWEFHIPETEDFAAAQSVTVVRPTVTQDAPSAVATLPRTASPVPLLGLLGSLFTMLGIGLAALARRSR